MQQEGNLQYLGDDASLYPEDLYKLEDKGEDKTIQKNNSLGPLIAFMRDLAAIDGNSSDDAWNKLMNPQHTLIHLAFSFLGASWDGLWYQASNSYMNQDLQTKQWTVITYDFDETFGNNSPDEKLMTVPYQQYARPNSTRPLVDKLLASPHWKNEFETILKTVIKRFFKPSIMEPRLQAWTIMLREDIAWDRQLQPRSPGAKSNFTVQDFENNMNTTTNGQAGILEFIKARSAATCQQLQFQDNDDLPPLPAYTQGRYMDASGQISDHQQGNTTTAPGGGSTTTSDATSMHLKSQHIVMAILMLPLFLFSN